MLPLPVSVIDVFPVPVITVCAPVPVAFTVSAPFPVTVSIAGQVVHNLRPRVAGERQRLDSVIWWRPPLTVLPEVLSVIVVTPVPVATCTAAAGGGHGERARVAGRVEITR